ncbi:hypothetical protein [Mesorhizobium sp. KR9-304]|uniref:hypothetical protein n=1 Tax=Mesorhizobium sp. KR9-304 TaxID=3156614 RepID=UPI0032B35278
MSDAAGRNGAGERNPAAGGKAGQSREARRKQAVVVVHGMGEQRPMSTLRGFVEAVWTQDPEIREKAGHANANKTWITPDKRAGSHELRRITTPYVGGIGTDFYELYWADVTRATTRSRLVAWVLELLWRKPGEIPPDARLLYRATAVITALFAIVALLVALSALYNPMLAALITAVGGVLFWFLDRFVVPYFGDVATYVQATPTTVAQRAEVRERGLKLLTALADDRRYDRIVLVGHSLGSIVAYDLLQILWAERRPANIEWKAHRAIFRAIHAVEKFAVLPGEEASAGLAGGSLEKLREAQWRLHQEIRNPDALPGKGWKISDFVTLGSPLTHAEFLVTHNMRDWRRGAMERLFALCPPLSDQNTKRRLLYEQGRNPKSGVQQYALHHGACFAATRWTNLYDLGNLLSTGDPISGAMAENFGEGVENVRVQLEGRLGRVFTHTLYWSLAAKGVEVGAATVPPRSHIEALRDAIDLRRELEPPDQH